MAKLSPYQEMAIATLCQALNVVSRLIDLIETHSDTLDIILKSLAEQINNDSPTDILENPQQILKNMSEYPKVQMNFNAPVSGVAGNVQGDMIVNPTPKTLAEAAQEIQELLVQLSQTYPTNTEAEKHIFVNKVDGEINKSSRLRNILIEGGIELIKIICPPLGIPIEMGRKWLETAQYRSE